MRPFAARTLDDPKQADDNLESNTDYQHYRHVAPRVLPVSKPSPQPLRFLHPLPRVFAGTRRSHAAFSNVVCRERRF